MIKNFRMQMIPLTQTPTVSNVRRLRYQFSSYISTTIADISPGSARNRAAPQESPQNLHTSNWLDTTLSHIAQIHLSHTPCSSQSGITKDRSILGILDEPLVSMNDRNNYPISEALREVSEPYSEPYWLARSDRASTTYTTQSDIGMFKSLPPALATSIISFCQAYVAPTLPDLCSLVLSGTLQDAVSNSQRHLRTSSRHNKYAGLKCPVSGCKTRILSDLTI